MNIKLHLAIIACVTAVAGCTNPTATPPQWPAEKTPRSTLSPDPTNYIHLNIDPVSPKEAEKFRPQAGYYARVIGSWTPRSLDNNGALRDVAIGAPNYDKEQRNWLERLVWGRNTTFSLVANIEVHSRLNYKTPIPLYSTSHNSGSEGESFDVFLKDIWFSPLIRVTADTRMTTEVSAHYKKEIKTGAVSAALRVARVAADQLAPGGKLLTTLNQDQVKKEANVWDSAIGHMLSSDGNEKRGGTALVEQWQADSTVIISLLSPGSSDAMMPERFIGSWLFKLDEPRMSLFSTAPCLYSASIDGNCGRNVVNAITPSLVLNEMVATDTTLVAALRKKDWYGQALITLNAKKDGVSQFCLQVVQAADDLGLNAIDAKLLLWALQTGEPLGEAMRDNISKDQTCQNQIKPFTFLMADSIAVEAMPASKP
jgi:hypothetical protein